MCVGRVYETYLASGSYCGSSMDSVRLLDATEDHAYYFGYRFRGNQNCLARQAFLRSYKFCIEESFKDKMKRSIRKLREDSFEEIVKQVARNLKRTVKDIMDSHNHKMFSRKMKQRLNLWPFACFKPSFSQDKRHVLIFS